jgi:hypothetical protein
MDLSKFLAGGGEYWKPLDFKAGDVGVLISEPIAQEKDFSGQKKVVLESVMEFRGEHKKVSISKGNALRISQKFGTDSKAWVGKPLRITPTKVQVGRELKDGLIMEPL